MDTYYLFGDSIMKGVMPDEDWNYHSSDAIDFPGLEKKYGIRIVNYSMPTFTSAQVSAWARSTMKRVPVPDCVFLEFGGNDCDYSWKAISDGTCGPDEKHRVAPDDFRKNYDELLNFFVGLGAKPIVVLPPKIHLQRYLDHLFASGVDEEKVMACMGSRENMGMEFDGYGKIMEEMASKYGCPMIHLNDRFPGPDKLDELYSADGMHPSAAGYGLFHESFDEFFSSNR